MKIAAILSILLLLAAPLAFGQEDDREATTLIKAGMKLPAFSVQTLEGKSVDSSSFQGKVVLVNFWATWCPPCKKEMPFLQKQVYDACKGEDFVMIAISRGETEKVVREFIAASPYTFPIGLDPDKKIYDLFASKYIPRSFVVDRQGVVRLATAGYEEKEFAAMVALVKTLLSR